MDYTTVAALAIFAATLFLMIKRPRGLRLGYAAGIGAMASLLLGTVSLGQAAQSFLDIWVAALAFIGIVALSVVLDAMGFFKWAALRVVRLAKGSGVRLYFYVYLLTAVVSILFANDSAVLILTPIVLEIISQLKIDGFEKESAKAGGEPENHQGLGKGHYSLGGGANTLTLFFYFLQYFTVSI